MTDDVGWEGQVRSLLREVDPGAAQTDVALLIRGGNSQRRRRVGATVAGACVSCLVALAVVALVVGAGPQPAVVPVTPPVSTHRSPSPPPSPSPSSAVYPPSPVRIAPAGTRIQISPSVYVRITNDSVCLTSTSPGTSPEQCVSTVPGILRPGAVTFHTLRGAAVGNFVTGVVSVQDAVTVLATDAGSGQLEVANVVRLPGHPRWVAFYAAFPYSATRPDLAVCDTLTERAQYNCMVAAMGGKTIVDVFVRRGTVIRGVQVTLPAR
jgi:hypothetical protein